VQLEQLHTDAQQQILPQIQPHLICLELVHLI